MADDKPQNTPVPKPSGEPGATTPETPVTPPAPTKTVRFDMATVGRKMKKVHQYLHRMFRATEQPKQPPRAYNEYQRRDMRAK